MAEIVERITELLQPLLESTDMFIVNVKVKPINNIKVFLDADNGLSIDKSASVNKKLYALIESESMFPEGDYSLEVSSPGVDEPLAQWRQYKKNIGRKVLVTPVEGPDQLGILKDVNEEQVVLEMKMPKKKEPVTVAIPFAEIKKTIVQIIF